MNIHKRKALPKISTPKIKFSLISDQSLLETFAPFVIPVKLLMAFLSTGTIRKEKKKKANNKIIVSINIY